MTRPAPRSDPLRSRASRVDKRRRPKKGLPDWYYRFNHIQTDDDGEPHPEDFDEDISELEEEERDKEPAECECDGDESECHCDFEDEDSVDEESERSYDGPDADFYYELKYMREERKRQLLKHEKDKEQMRESERPKIDEARAAYESFKTGNNMPMKSIADHYFELFSLDHVDRFYTEVYRMKRADFYYSDEDGQPGDECMRKHGGENGEKPLFGQVYLDGAASCSFGPFRLPTGTSHELKVKSDDNKYDLWFEFVGNGNEYLKLRISSALVFKNPLGSSSGAPEMFEFFGVLRDLEKERKERQESIARRRSTFAS
jgi:hypothetical protein